jgi:hypothetical protein
MRLKDSIPWPQEGDQLFTSNGDWWHNACLNFVHDNGELYVDGYKRAADILVEYVLRNRMYIDLLVYPIIFLYRQYLELRLKELIQHGRSLIDDPGDFPKHHNIDRLWKQLRYIIEKSELETKPEDFNVVESCINEFSLIDPSSMAFRYATDKDGKPSLPDLTHINLKHFSDVTQKIASFLEGASTGISVYLGYKRDMESF